MNEQTEILKLLLDEAKTTNAILKNISKEQVSYEQIKQITETLGVLPVNGRSFHQYLDEILFELKQP